MSHSAYLFPLLSCLVQSTSHCPAIVLCLPSKHAIFVNYCAILITTYQLGCCNQSPLVNATRSSVWYHIALSRKATVRTGPCQSAHSFARASVALSGCRQFLTKCSFVPFKPSISNPYKTFSDKQMLITLCFLCHLIFITVSAGLAIPPVQLTSNFVKDLSRTELLPMFLFSDLLCQMPNCRTDSSSDWLQIS